MNAALRARAAQSDAIARQQAAKRAQGAVAATEARIASHGATGLPEWLSANLGGAERLCRTMALLAIKRAGIGGDVLRACQERML